jgi:polysaccharide biosynthesis protein PslJ
MPDSDENTRVSQALTIASPTRGPALVAVLSAVALGVLVAALPTPLAPVLVGGGLIGLVVLGFILWRPILGVYLFVLVVATLPFGVIPVSVGAQLTLVDFALITTFVSFALRLPALAREPNRLLIGAVGGLLLLFVCVAIAAFLVGSGYTALTPESVRRVGKLLASLLLFLVAGNVVDTRQRLFRLVAALMGAGALAGALATLIWLLPATTQLQLLSSLAPLGYPSTDVLRYVPGSNDTYTSQLRAVGTAIDPNVLGGTVMLALLLTVVQWASPRPVLARPLLVVFGLASLAGVLSSLSRASWVGLAAGILVIGALRYRRLWLVLGGALVLALVLPAGRDLVVRFVGGFSSADPATAFRFGEYLNALTIIGRYPLLGIGFGRSPDIDVTAGVSSVYLLVAEQTGLVGLVVFACLLLATWLTGWRGLARARADLELDGVLAGLLAAVSGALVAGLLDHYFANQAFPHAVALFWLYVAALAVAARLSARRAQEEARTIRRAGSTSGRTGSWPSSDSARPIAAAPSSRAGWATVDSRGRR